MAVSGKTAAPHEIPYFLGTDKPPDMAAVTKAMADRLETLLSKTKTVRATSASLAAGATGAVTLTWPEAFADTNYTVAVSPRVGANITPPAFYVDTKTAEKIEVVVKNNDGSSRTFVFEAIAIHD